MNDIPGALFTGAVLVACLVCLRIRPGFMAWDRTDKINYVLLAGSLWPWLILRYFVDPLPLWYTVAVWIVAGVSFVWFMVAQVRFLRRSRRSLRELNERYAAHLDQHPEQ